MLRKYIKSKNIYWYEIIWKYIYGFILVFTGDIEFCFVNDGLEFRGLEFFLDMGGKLVFFFLFIDGV